MLIYIRSGRDFFKKDKTTVISYGITVKPLNRIFFQVKSFHEKVSKLFLIFSLVLLFFYPFVSSFHPQPSLYSSSVLLQKKKK